jgi:K+-transporting ATPase ATPase C chain
MRQLKTAVLVLGVFSLLLGIVYPLVITVIAQVLFPYRANGSLIQTAGRRPQTQVAVSGAGAGGLENRDTTGFRGENGSVPIFGSELIGQSFTGSGYFHSRPSDCGYNGAGSAASNLGPSNPALFDQVRARIDSLRQNRDTTGFRGENGSVPIFDSAPIPADLVLSSASGLDPEISPNSALLQTAGVARARGLPVDAMRDLVRRQTRAPFLGVLGEPRVNTLKLNLALDSMSQGNVK